VGVLVFLLCGSPAPALALPTINIITALDRRSLQVFIFFRARYLTGRQQLCEHHLSVRRDPFRSLPDGLSLRKDLQGR